MSLRGKIEDLYQSAGGSQIADVHLIVDGFNNAIDAVLRLLDEQEPANPQAPNVVHIFETDKSLGDDEYQRLKTKIIEVFGEGKSIVLSGGIKYKGTAILDKKD